MEKLYFQSSPVVTFATNQFWNVPVILKVDDTPMLSVVRDQQLGFTSEIPIYHSDGTYLAKVRGTRLYRTEAGKAAGIEIRDLPNVTVCELGKQTVFEIRHEQGDAFRAQAELYTPSGLFVKFADTPKPVAVRADGSGLQIGGMTISQCQFAGCAVGVWIRSDGSMAIGVNG